MKGKQIKADNMKIGIVGSGCIAKVALDGMTYMEGIECTGIWTREQDMPAFDQNFSGGALYDINLYNIHFVAELFGKPNSIEYTPNIGYNGVDTSGILVLKYNDFAAVCVGAKDSNSENSRMIQGTKGYLKVSSAPGGRDSVDLVLNGEMNKCNHNSDFSEHYMISEFTAFKEMIESNDFKRCYDNLEFTKDVMYILENARKSCNLKFLAHEK